MNKKSKSINSIRYDNNIKNQDDLNNSYELQMLHVAFRKKIYSKLIHIFFFVLGIFE